VLAHLDVEGREGVLQLVEVAASRTENPCSSRGSGERLNVARPGRETIRFATSTPYRLAIPTVPYGLNGRQLCPVLRGDHPVVGFDHLRPRPVAMFTASRSASASSAIQARSVRGPVRRPTGSPSALRTYGSWPEQGSGLMLGHGPEPDPVARVERDPRLVPCMLGGQHVRVAADARFALARRDRRRGQVQHGAPPGGGDAYSVSRATSRVRDT
jgi:hypothetical protein